MKGIPGLRRSAARHGNRSVAGGFFVRPAWVFTCTVKVWNGLAGVNH